jgi:hypothetical protein
MTDLTVKLAGRRVVASVSGGKDSAAMSFWLTEQGIEHDRVFCDTGWEHTKTYDYLRGELTSVIGPIVEIRGDLLMPDLVRKKGMFPSRTRRFCTEELKSSKSRSLTWPSRATRPAVRRSRAPATTARRFSRQWALCAPTAGRMDGAFPSMTWWHGPARQYEMFAAPEEAGCMRWGLCETKGDE